jgi:Leu/Phe-tRNA-protein transferase
MTPNVTSSDHGVHSDVGDAMYKLPLSAFIPPYLANDIVPWHGDFCYSRVGIHRRLLLQLLVEGFLPIASQQRGLPSANNRYLPSSRIMLLPKLHEHRCMIPLQGQTPFHVSKSIRKKTRNAAFHLTLNRSFEQVVSECWKQHGNHHCWLYEPLISRFRQLQQATCRNQPYSARLSDNNTCPVHFYSVELWDSDNELVAGELGYTVGSVYTSLTGFSNQDSAGSIQLTALGILLQQSNFTMWDLGMEMPYKLNINGEGGTILMPRHEFVQYIHQTRLSRGAHLSVATVPVASLIHSATPPTNVASIPTISKNQQKKQARSLKRLQNKAKQLQTVPLGALGSDPHPSSVTSGIIGCDR